jgi:hypothetical protein
MRKISSRENTLARKFSLVVISTVEKKFAKTQAFDWLRYFVIQNTSIWLASLFPFRNGVETNHSKIMLRMRSTFSREIFRISLVELGLNTNIYKICKLYKAIFSKLYNISQPIFAILLWFHYVLFSCGVWFPSLS